MTDKEQTILPSKGDEISFFPVSARVVYGPPHRCFFRGKEYDDQDQWVEDVWSAIQGLMRSKQKTSR